jgi:hypothetical protein
MRAARHGLQAFEQLKAIEVGQAHIEHRECGQLSGELAQSLFGGATPHRLETVDREHVLQGIGNAGLVFSQKNAGVWGEGRYRNGAHVGDDGAFIDLNPLILKDLYDPGTRH